MEEVHLSSFCKYSEKDGKRVKQNPQCSLLVIHKEK